MPPRNSARNATSTECVLPIDETGQKESIDRLKVPTKLYENVIVNKTYDAELVAFYDMVNHHMISMIFIPKITLMQRKNKY